MRYLDLIFETDGDNILDIYNCAKFKSDKKIKKLKYKRKLRFLKMKGIRLSLLLNICKIKCCYNSMGRDC